MTVVISSSSKEIMAEPERLFDAMAKGHIIELSDVGYTIVPTPAVDEAEDMVSLSKEVTGVNNTIFVSTKGYGRHAARIKIAIDPPDCLNAAGKNESMAIHDYSVTGDVPPRIAEQAKRFIERNRQTLIDYWENKIDTAEMIRRLKTP